MRSPTREGVTHAPTHLPEKAAKFAGTLGAGGTMRAFGGSGTFTAAAHPAKHKAAKNDPAFFMIVLPSLICYYRSAESRCEDRLIFISSSRGQLRGRGKDQRLD